MKNVDLTHRILTLTGRPASLIKPVADRPGHDRRYALDWTKVRDQLGWEPTVDFDSGLRETAEWYRDNEPWWGPIRSGEYRDYYERQYGRSLG